MSLAEPAYELAKLHSDRGDFDAAIEKYREAAERFFQERNFDQYLKCQNMLLRIYADRDDQEKITQLKEHLQDLVLKEGFDLNAKTYYTLALCSCYRSQYENALEYLKKSISLALKEDNKEDICYAVSGFAITYSYMGRFQDALRELYNLQVFFEVLDLPMMKLSAQITNGYIFRRLKRYDEAIELFWQAYDTVKEAKSFTSYYPHLLYQMGITHFEAGNKDLARIYLELASKTVDRNNLVGLARRIDDSVAKTGGKLHANYDLIFQDAQNTVIEKKLGKIDFKNQFILLDLLRLFVRSPGEVYSKEQLVREVWKQSYNPAVHDNKIYVTIKRLRKLIEPEYDKPKYIFRAKNGYYLNKSVRVQVQH